MLFCKLLFQGVIRKRNVGLYSPNGVFGVCSVFLEPRFTKRMQQAGFKVEEIRARAHGKRGSKHMIWLGEHRQSYFL